MAMIVSIGSGKGGVGKSVIAANLSMLLAKQGKRVVLADLDVGGADAHILFGMLNPPRTLTDFVERRVERLEDVLQQVSAHPFLQLIPGTGDTPVSYTHLRPHETVLDIVCRLLLEKKQPIHNTTL